MVVVFLSHSDTQVAFAKIQGGNSLVDDCEIRAGGCKEEYAVQFKRNEMSGFAWFWMEVWKLKGLRSGVETGTCPSWQCEGSATHIVPTAKNKKAGGRNFWTRSG
jgi:hypothetical protein